ncbi:putative ribonuclease H-like domain-containing protein [Tanacetum coccineum]
MEAGTTSTTLTARLPILNPGEYDLWLMRIEQYFLMTDYSLWEVILNGNKVLKRTVGETEQEYEPTTIEEKQDRRNEMKARGTLLMALPNKDQLKFHSYKDAKLLMEAIEKRYGGNKESKKVQRTLLKQQYENFSGSSSETMDQTFDRLQKLISQLEIQGEVITQEDMNLKLLRSLPSEWKTHALIWRNKEEIETISLDDLYNNLKIYEPELTGLTNTSQNSQNVAFMSSNSTNSNSNSSTNKADNTTYGVSAAHTQSNPTSGDNLKQIDPDDLEEIDLQWEMAMLTIKARRFIKRTGRKLDVNGQRVRFDRGRENSRRTVTVETPTENALVAQDGIGGYDWSYQAEEEHPTNYALMAYTSSGSSSSSDSKVDSCSKSCVKAYATLKEQYDSLSSDYKKSQFNLVSYKAGLESVEARLAHYKKNEAVKSSKPDLMFMDEIVESENMDVITVVTPSNVKKVESNHESADVKNNGDAVEPKTVRKNSFRPPVIEDWNSDDDSEVEFIPNVKDKTVRPSTKKIKFVKSARETVEKVIRLVRNNSSRVNHKNFANKMTHSHPNRRFVPQAVLTRATHSRRSTGKKEYLTVVVLVLSSDFKLLDESQVLLRVPRKDNIYSVNLKSVVPTKGLTCLFAKATIDESNLWHRKESNTKSPDETSGILKTFIKEIENQLDHKVKVIRSDNGTEFKNSVMNQFCKMKGIKREFSIARTPQQDGIGEMKNRTLIEVARTMLVDSKLPTTFWTEVVNTACYVLNRVLVIKPNSKTPYELIRRRTPLIDFMKPFGFPVTILNTRDHLGKFDGKADEGFFVGYSMVIKAIRVFNKRTRIVKETLNIRFLENAPNVTGNGPDWIFDVDSLSKSMNYVPVVKLKRRQNQGSEEDAGVKPIEVDESEASDKDRKNEQDSRSDFERLLQQEKQTEHPNNTNSINTGSTPVSTAEPSSTNDAPSSPVNAAKTSEEHLFEQFSPFKNAFTLPDVPNVSLMDDNTRIFAGAYDDEDVGGQADLNNLETTMNVSSIPTTRINKDHLIELIIGDLHSAPLTRRMSQQNLEEHCLKVWTLVDLPNCKRAIGTKWVFRNKKDEKGIIVRNKVRLVAQGYTQEEGIDYDEVFAHVARIEAIGLFLAYASFMGFIV